MKKLVFIAFVSVATLIITSTSVNAQNKIKANKATTEVKDAKPLNSATNSNKAVAPNKLEPIKVNSNEAKPATINNAEAVAKPINSATKGKSKDAKAMELKDAKATEIKLEDPADRDKN